MFLAALSVEMFAVVVKNQTKRLNLEHLCYKTKGANDTSILLAPQIPAAQPCGLPAPRAQPQAQHLPTCKADYSMSQKEIKNAQDTSCTRAI